MMLKKMTFLGNLVGLGFLLGVISGVSAAEMPADHSSQATQNTRQFQRFERPWSSRVAVTLGGLGLIGLELWWFLLSKPKLQTASQSQAARQKSP
jgi:plastocyanin domain-containing protein